MALYFGPESNTLRKRRKRLRAMYWKADTGLVFLKFKRNKQKELINSYLKEINFG